MSEDKKLDKNIQKATENIPDKKEVKMEDITESLDNSPIWPAGSDEVKEELEKTPHDQSKTESSDGNIPRAEDRDE